MSEPPIASYDPGVPERESRDTSHERRRANHDDDEINLLDIAIVILRHKKLILGLPFVVAILTAGITLLMPNIYTATTTILPPQQSQSAASAMLAQLGGMGGLVAGATALKSTDALYVAMLKSRTVADNLIQRFDLTKRYEEKSQSSVRNALESRIAIKAEQKSGIISIDASDKDPQFAADLANAYVDELMKLTQIIAVTEAAQRRLFFERQLAIAKENLDTAQIVARKALAQGGLINVDMQGRAMLEATALLRARITAKQVQIGAMRTFAADGNPDLRLAQQELDSMKQELAKIEGASGESEKTSSLSRDMGIDNLRLLRNLKYNETLYELLAKQYEMAKIDEAKDSSVVQVMDKAIAPDRKSKPQRALIVMIAILVAGLAAIAWVFLREALASAGNDPGQSERLQTVKRYFAWR